MSQHPPATAAPEARAASDAPSNDSRPSGKVRPWHRERKAIVYVRQSTAYQVIHHRESKDLQYALVDRASELGWRPDQVEVIDEDQGHSGATTEGRLGFQRLLAEVGLDHVGIIFGVEMSRLARSNKDWHQLLELCALFRTLLADQDGLYDPTDYNDRLLLGLKGTMSEAELHILKSRLYQGLLNKARRGELFTIPPIGYIKNSAGEFQIDPDEQVQAIVRLIFDQFDRLGTMSAVFRYLVRHGLRIGIRPHGGPNRGQLEWRAPTRDAVRSILQHPIYAGFYRHGHRHFDPRRKKPGQPHSGRVIVPPGEYVAFLPDRCPAYITKERYEANQRRLAANRARAEYLGAPREGPSLLGGLLRCGHCGRRLSVRYSNNTGQFRYGCWSGEYHGKGPACQSLAGRVLDALVVEQVLAALQPATLELSLAAAEDIQQERARLDQLWQQRLERARYQTERAERQYQAVEPENRLVARTLEAQWEAALRQLQELQQEYARFQQTQPAPLSAHEREQILALARDLPPVWHASTTTAVDRQRVIRLLIERVVVKVRGESDQVEVTLEWVGGFTTQHELVRPVLRHEQRSDYDRLMGRIRELRGRGQSLASVAEALNREGFRPIKGSDRYNGDMVGRILARRDPGRRRTRKKVARGLLQKDEWLLLDLAKKLRMPKNTLSSWLRRGWVQYRRLPGYHGRCLCWADAEELKRLERLRDTPHGWWDPPLPEELTTPKCRPTK